MENNSYNVIEGLVVDNKDIYGGSRIKVRLGNVYDGSLKDEELPYCSPLLPKLIHIIPKPGEIVLVFLQKSGSGDSNRFYVGPILSQPYYFKHELADTATSLLLNKKTKPNPNPSLNPLNEGSLPEVEDVGFVGRSNCDILLKENEIDIRCGQQKNSNDSVENRLNFNTISPSIIQLRYSKRKDPKDKDEYESSINLFADKINLLSRNSDKFIGNIDKKEMISEEMMNKILEECHPLIYGDYLVTFLKKFMQVFLNHTHPYSMLPPALNANDLQTANTNFDDMLSPSVKTC